jgi:hypothetical protein
VIKALAKNPENRYQSADCMLKDLWTCTLDEVASTTNLFDAARENLQAA